MKPSEFIHTLICMAFDRENTKCKVSLSEAMELYTLLLEAERAKTEEECNDAAETDEKRGLSDEQTDEP